MGAFGRVSGKRRVTVREANKTAEVEGGLLLQLERHAKVADSEEG